MKYYIDFGFCFGAFVMGCMFFKDYLNQPYCSIKRLVSSTLLIFLTSMKCSYDIYQIIQSLIQ